MTDVVDWLETEHHHDVMLGDERVFFVRSATSLGRGHVVIEHENGDKSFALADRLAPFTPIAWSSCECCGIPVPVREGREAEPVMCEVCATSDPQQAECNHVQP